MPDAASPCPLSPEQEPVLSLRRLWASGYQVILSYESQLVARHPQLWPAIPYWWANKIMAQEVIRYLDWNKDMGRPGESVCCDGGGSETLEMEKKQKRRGE